MKAGKPERADIDPRYVQLVMQNVIRDVFDALVELITNSDDSYHRLYSKGTIHKDGGPISIWIERHYKNVSRITVKDRAEGMTLSEMREKIKGIGKKTSLDDDRGFMGRGAKECAVLGKAIFESIKDGKYYKSEFTSNLEFIPYEPSMKASSEIRKTLGIRDSGTAATLEIRQEKRIPRFDNIVRDLPHHFALRDIFSKEGPTKVILIEGSRKESLIHQDPDGELKLDEVFEVPDYPGVQARLKIWRSSEPLDGYSDRFRRSGLVIKGERAIHECSLLADEFEKDPLASRYFGRIECPYIDQLCREYDMYLAKGENPPDDNFCLIIDPNRQKGLRRDHPFTKSLIKIPSEHLRKFIAKDRESEKQKTVQVANQETKDRLDRLAKAASKFLSEQLEEVSEVSADDLVDRDAFAQTGILIYPTYFKVAIGEQRRLGIYAKSNVLKDTQSVALQSESNALVVLDPVIELKPHRKRTDTFLGYFRVEGKSIATVSIKASVDQRISAEAIAQVVDTRIEEHFFTEPLEFEFDNYQIREGKRRTIRLFAKYPDVISEATKVEVTSSDSEGIPIRGRCEIAPIAGSNYACGEVVVQGRKLNARAEIRALAKEYVASTQVKVIKGEEKGKIPIRIELRDEDYGNFRARWAEHEGQPNLLLISAKHRSLRRYLGPPPNFEGQDRAYFKILIAEIVTESVCRKSLVLEAKERNWEFHWADLKDDYLIADSVLAELHRRMREFAAIAHSIMLEQKDLERIQQGS